jgi:hypothetical protein
LGIPKQPESNFLLVSNFTIEIYIIIEVYTWTFSLAKHEMDTQYAWIAVLLMLLNCGWITADQKRASGGISPASSQVVSAGSQGVDYRRHGPSEHP